MERGVKRSLLYFECVFGGALDGLGNRMPMRRAQYERTQDEHVQRTLEDLSGIGWFVYGQERLPPLE